MACVNQLSSSVQCATDTKTGVSSSFHVDEDEFGDNGDVLFGSDEDEFGDNGDDYEELCATRIQKIFREWRQEVMFTRSAAAHGVTSGDLVKILDRMKRRGRSRT